MRWLSLPVLVLAVLPAALAAPVPKHLMKDEPFWPTAVGTKWVYELKDREFRQEIIKSEPIQGGIKLIIKSDSQSLSDSVVEVTLTGVIARSIDRFKLDTQLVRLPVRVDDSWEFAYPVQDGILCEGGIMTVGASEDVKVPAGEFRAVKVVRTVTSEGGVPIAKPRSDTSWYAKGVGLVKQKRDSGGFELKAFAPGKK